MARQRDRRRHPGRLDRRPRDEAARRAPPGHPAGSRRALRRRVDAAARDDGPGRPADRGDDEGLQIGESGDPAIERYESIDALADAVAAGTEMPEHVLVGSTRSTDSCPRPTPSRRARSSCSRHGWRLSRLRAPGSCSSLVVRWRLPTVSARICGRLRCPAYCAAPSEHPDRFALIDSDGGELTDTTLLHGAALGRAEVALRQDALLVPRLQHRGGDALVPDDGDAHWHVSVETPGTLESLRLARTRGPRTRSPPGRCASRSMPPGSTSATWASLSACSTAGRTCRSATRARAS